jgi:hypothetical protein
MFLTNYGKLTNTMIVNHMQDRLSPVQSWIIRTMVWQLQKQTNKKIKTKNMCYFLLGVWK